MCDVCKHLTSCLLVSIHAQLLSCDVGPWGGTSLTRVMAINKEDTVWDASISTREWPSIAYTKHIYFVLVPNLNFDVVAIKVWSYW